MNDFNEFNIFNKLLRNNYPKLCDAVFFLLHLSISIFFIKVFGIIPFFFTYNKLHIKHFQNYISIED